MFLIHILFAFMKKRYKTVILSDIHLGKPVSKIGKLMDFLNSIEFDKLIINGDCIDFWQLGILWRWTERETKFINYIINFAENWVELVYIKGNHDKFIRHLEHMHLYNVSIVNDMTYVSWDDKKYYIGHGDRFDYVCYHLPSLAKFMNFIYTMIYLVENLFGSKKNWAISVSERIKTFFKKILFPKGMLYKRIAKWTKKRNFDWIIFWHYHMPDRRLVNGIDCINSWDRIISCTAVVENDKWNMELIYHK